jgi:ComF family protein
LETSFLTGLVCDQCGVPLPGQDITECARCDSCLSSPPPWRRGRAALAYSGQGRRLVLALKHGDRLDLVRPMARWMAGAAQPLLQPEAVIVPVPLSGRRRMRRRFNQAAALGNAMAEELALQSLPDLLSRRRHSPPQEGMGREERFENQKNAIVPGRTARERLAARPVLLVDDVMTSGATLAAATEACYASGACRVDVLALARVVEAP